MLAQAHALAVLTDVKHQTGAVAAALISPDGRILQAELPSDVYGETFAIMCATIFGAAANANAQLGLPRPESATWEVPGARAVILRTASETLLVVVAPTDDPSRVLEIARRFASAL